MKRIAPMLTEWMGTGDQSDSDEVIAMRRELRALKAVARAARTVAWQEPIIMASDVHRLQRALVRLRGPARRSSGGKGAP